MQPRLSPGQLRSHRWFGPNDLRSFGHRARARQMGLGTEDWEGKPVRNGGRATRTPAAAFLSLFLNEVTQADAGCDFRFLHDASELRTEPAIH